MFDRVIEHDVIVREGRVGELFLNRHLCFEGKAWKRCNLEVRVLTEVFRQEDKTFVGILNELRMGRTTEETFRILNACVRELPQQAVKPTLLFPKNDEVQLTNIRELERLGGQIHSFHSKDRVEVDPSVDEKDR